MFQITMQGGQNMGLPDVCLTPAGPAVVPVPYPNISMPATANPGTAAQTVLVACMPALNKISQIPMSNGDEAGANLGVASGMVMGPTTFVLGSFTVFMQGAPAVKLTSMTGHNGFSMNCPGTCLAPSQTLVAILS
ncbi:MAG: DUF4150 domain-containing protein [Pseudomonadota bacterium]